MIIITQQVLLITILGLVRYSSSLLLQPPGSEQEEREAEEEEERRYIFFVRRAAINILVPLTQPAERHALARLAGVRQAAHAHGPQRAGGGS